MKLSTTKAVFYGLGNLMGIGSGMLVQWLLYYYSPPKNSGLTPLAPIVAMGVVMLFGRIIDAISDPLIGWWSDRTYTRWGRRKPFIITGCILMALSQTLIWIPLVHEKTIINAIYAAVLLGVYWFGFTAALAPYLALLPEIAESDEERIRLTSYQAFFLEIGFVINGIIVPFILLKYLGFFYTSIVLTIIMFASMLPLILTINERVTVEKIAKDIGLFEAIMLTLRNRVFITYLIMIFFLQLAMNMMIIAIPYGVTAIGLSKYDVGYFNLPILIVSLLTIPIYKKLSIKWGKKKVFMISILGLSILALIASSMGTIPINPLLFIIVLGTLVGAFIIPQNMMPNAFIAEIADLDEALTGYRREAMYFGVQGLIWKSAAGAAAILTSILLNTFGYNPENYLGVRLVYLTAAISLIMAAFILTKYKITRPR